MDYPLPDFSCLLIPRPHILEKRYICRLKRTDYRNEKSHHRPFLGSHAFIPSLQSEEAFNRFRNQQYNSHSPHADADFKSLLLREQEGRCCYCMRRISADVKDSNIEHLVPKKSASADYSYYAGYSDLLNYHSAHGGIRESGCVVHGFSSLQQCQGECEDSAFACCARYRKQIHLFSVRDDGDRG